MTSLVLHKADLLLAEAESLGPILALDTSTARLVASVALNGRCVAQVQILSKSHAAQLPGAVKEALERAGVKLRELAGVAVGIGPGSFTGVRIGLSYAKGVAFAVRCPIAGVSSLDSLAVCALDNDNVSIGTTVCPVIDARRGEFYTAFYRFDQLGLSRDSDELVLNASAMASRCYEKTTILLIGEPSLAGLAGELCQANGGAKEVRWCDDLSSLGKALAAIGAARIKRGHNDPLHSLEPHYVREPQVRDAEKFRPAPIEESKSK